MAVPISDAGIPWWKEPTKDQWYAFGAAWLSWVLDAFDFTVFLLIMVPIAKVLGPETKGVEMTPELVIA
jgi:MFS transporter, SHS family, lactate transporter